MTLFSSPWRKPDFLKLWSAQAISAVGARLTREGLPMAAVLGLGATPGQIGLMAALSRGPALVIGLTLGGYVDRSRRRGLMIAMDLARAALLMTVPVAAWLHWLSLPHLYLAAAAVGAASVLFEIADHAYLPGLVEAEHLNDANASLGATESVAEVAGPALAGALFQWLGGPYAIALNALTYLLSAGFLGAISHREAKPEISERPRLGRDVADGLGAALAEPRVAPLLIMEGSNALFGSFFSALYLIFALRILGLTTSMLGLTVACGGIGALAGSWIGPRVARVLGVGPAIATLSLSAALSMFLIPLAPGERTSGMAFLSAGQVVGDALWVASGILATSLRQSLLPQAMLGRVAATFQATAGGLGIAGALIGGYLGGVLGPRETLLIATIGMMIGPVVTAGSALRTYGPAR
jgi:predicted MFS family arabinose efflux permease